MKRCKALIAALLSVTLAAVPGTAFAAEKLSRVSPGVYRLFEEGETVRGVIRRGVDVSHWQGEIDWKKAKAHDVDFVFLGTRYQNKLDPMFEKNAREADAAGIRLGAYIYSYATTVEMAEKEADFVLDIIKDYPISYPIAFDAENAETLGRLPKDEITKCVNAFMKKISDAGYYPILYANDNWLANKLDMNALSKYPVWVAAYERLYKYKNPVMWQGTESGTVDGIPDGVDIDLMFKEIGDKTPADTWRQIGGVWYYYKNYRMQKGTLINDGSHSYYMNDDGTVYTGWRTMDGKKYYFDGEASGIMRHGWRSIGGKWYFFDNTGALSTGWISDGGNWYYSNKDGVMQTGKQVIDGQEYEFTSSGTLIVPETEAAAEDAGAAEGAASSEGAAAGAPAQSGAEAAVPETGAVVPEGAAAPENASGIVQAAPPGSVTETPETGSAAPVQATSAAVQPTQGSGEGTSQADALIVDAPPSGNAGNTPGQESAHHTEGGPGTSGSGGDPGVAYVQGS